MKTILIVDDSGDVRFLLDEYLTEQGYAVIHADNGVDALTILEQQTPSIILLDVMMPKLDGFQVITKIRRRSRVPIIMLTSKRHEEDMIRGFELGADDYITKPFRMRELLMRVRAVLRRTSHQQSAEPVLQVGRIVFDKNKRSVIIDEQPIELTAVEICLLERLMGSAEHVLNRAELSTHLIENGFSGSENTLKIHIRNIRGKIEHDPTAPRFIETVFGVGYRLRELK